MRKSIANYPLTLSPTLGIDCVLSHCSIYAQFPAFSVTILAYDLTFPHSYSSYTTVTHSLPAPQDEAHKDHISVWAQYRAHVGLT